MADMLTIGALATNTFKRALDVTSHNVANIGTEGYSRQRAEILSNAPNVVGQSFLGGGAKIDTIERINAEYVQRQLYTSQALVDRYEASNALAQQVEGVVAGNDEGVKDFMQRFFDSLQTVASNPTSAPTRQLLIDEASNLESHISNLSSVLEDIQTQTNTQIKDLTIEVNDRLETIHSVNEMVERALATGSQTPNDLLDKRDQAILELSQYVDIQTFPQESGAIEIHTANGKVPLINDNNLTRLQAAQSPFPDERRVEIYASVGGDLKVISDRIAGGELGGVLDFRSNMLDKARNDLGLTLNGVVASMNWQHYQGYDSNGDQGEDFFQPLSMTALNRGDNTGTEDGTSIHVSFNPNFGVAEPPYNGAGVSADPATFGAKQTSLDTAITEIGNFTSRDYLLRYNSATDEFEFFDNKTRAAVTDNAGNPVTVPRGATAVVEGFTFDLSTVGAGTVGQGDEFLVKPHQQILKDFEVAISDPDTIATRGQSPIDSNSDGSLLDEATGPAAYGDNTNMANMASLQSKEILLSDESGTASSTLLGGYSVMASNVGMYVRSTDIQLTAQENVFQQIMDQRESISGVSLDEEAANLLKYQQAYEASAQIISTAQSLFQTLLGVVRG